MSDNQKPCQAREPKDLNDYLMNSNHAKSEAEWYASRIIEAADELAKTAQMINQIHPHPDLWDKATNKLRDAIAAYEKARGAR